jgi:serine/threonine-protein kinase RsbW
VSDAARDVVADEIVCEARREHLAEVLAFVDRACMRAGVGQEVLFDVRLAVEEVVTNVIEHGYRGAAAGPVTVRFRRDPTEVVVTVEDLARPFDPTQVKSPDITAPIEERRIGGLGWHFVRQVMDDVRHEHLSANGSTKGNRVTLVKRLSTTE